MNKIYEKIVKNVSESKKMLAVLLDPEKCVGSQLKETLYQFVTAKPDFVFIGGSTKNKSTDELFSALEKINVPKILFPGDVSQFSDKADALLFLSLLSGDNVDYLIGQHKKVALQIKKSRLEVIPTAYVLVAGGNVSSVQKVSKTQPIDQQNVTEIVATAVSGELFGMKMVYLEAGSGALTPVGEDVIRRVKKELDIPLIVGGGIKTEQQLRNAYRSGADVVVVGNLFETESDKISSFIDVVGRINDC